MTMTSTLLKHKWSGLSENPVTSGFRSLRISSECVPDLFLGVSNDGKRSLILALPDKKILNFTGIKKEYLSIDYYKKENLIVLQSLDNNFFDLFDDLILSLYLGIKHLSNVDDYSKYFIQTFHRWSLFFEDKKSDKLSEEEVKGLFGELLVLKLFVKNKGSAELDSVISAWVGPYDDGHDFSFDAFDVEVKTKNHSSLDINISSEYQLESEIGKGLELFVVSVEFDSTVGLSIKELVVEIKDYIVSNFGDTSIFLKALFQKGLTLNNLHLYDIYRFKPVEIVVYNCCINKFPKLSRSNIPNEVLEVKYKLRTSLLDEFVINKISY